MSYGTSPTPRGGRSRGQALVEFAVVFPVLFVLLAGIIQFGLIFWSQNTLTQIARDTGRWAATQQDCSATGPVVAKANAIATQSSLFGYAAGSWDGTDNVTVTWAGAPCPPSDNTEEAWVTVAIEHTVPIFFPFVPGNGNISTSTEFRMEPAP